MAGLDADIEASTCVGTRCCDFDTMRFSYISSNMPSRINGAATTHIRMNWSSIPATLALR